MKGILRVWYAAVLAACAGGADPAVVIEVPGTPAEAVLVSTPEAFTRWDPGTEVLPAVDDLALRDAPSYGAPVAHTVPFGTPLTLLEVLGEPEEVDGRDNVWYRASTADGRQGAVFGGDLTSLHGVEVVEGAEQPWAVSYGPGRRARLAMGLPGQVGVLDLKITRRFEGGQLTARVDPWGEGLPQFVVEQCSDEADPPCAVAHARLGGPSGVRQVTPHDVERYPLPSLAEATCAGAEPTVLDEIEVETLLELELPPPAWGPSGPAPCKAVAVVDEGPLEGRRIVSCVVDVQRDPYPAVLEVLRYLEGEESWTFLPCSSDLDHADEVHAALAEHRIRVTVDPTVVLGAPLATPATITDGDVTATLAWRTPYEVPRDLMLRLFKDEAGGWVYRTKVLAFEDPDAQRSPLVRGALALVQPDGGAVLYQWKPPSGPITWSRKEPGHSLDYVSESLDCTGSPSWFVNLIPDIGKPDILRVGNYADGTPVFVFRDERHPMQMEWLLDYRNLNEDPSWTPPEGLERTSDNDDLLDSRPWLFLVDPWDRMIKLVREDLVKPVPCR